MTNNTPMTPDREQAPWGRAGDGRPRLPMGAHWTDIPELVDEHLAGIQGRVTEAQPGKWYVSPTAAGEGMVCTQYDGYTQSVGQLTNMLPADLKLTLHAHSDLSWCLGLITKLRARVAELEAAACSCYDPAFHAPECRHASVVWEGVTYNAASWYRDASGEWWRAHSVNADGELLMQVCGDNAYEPMLISEVLAEVGVLTLSEEGPKSVSATEEPW